MKIFGRLCALVLFIVMTVVGVAATDYILEAKKANDFSPEVDKLWQQAERGIFRKDENGNFERFLRMYYHYPQSIEVMAFSLQQDMGMGRRA